MKQPPPLSRRKAQWADRFRPARLKGSTLNPSAAEVEYFEREVTKLAESLTREVSRDVLALFRAPAALAVIDA